MNSKSKHIPSFIFFFILSFNVLFGTTYFVDSKNGNDLNSGLNIKEAWQNICKINNTYFEPGDSILLKSGSIWREELVIPSSGTSEYPIVISSYGDGEKPKILGSNYIKSFQKVEKNIWKAEILNEFGWIWFSKNNYEYIWGNKREVRNQLYNEYDFYVDSNSVYFYSPQNMIDDNISIEISYRDFGIISGWYSNSKNNIVIENLEIAFTKNANIRQIGGSNWKIINIESHHSGAIDESDGQGIQIEGYNNIIASCKIYENGQHGIYISSFGNFHVNDNLIEQNVIYNNYHTSIDLMNDGGDENSHLNTIIRRNFIYDENDFKGKEIGIQTLGYGKGNVKNVTIHHNIIKNIKGIGISIVKNSDSIFVHNNTVYETESACLSVDNENGYTELFNNIGVNNSYYAVIFLHSFSNKVIDYNFWYTNKNNHTNNIFIEQDYYNDLNKFRNKYQFDLHGSFSDPKLLLNNDNIVDLSKDSYCINSGKRLNYLSDYFGEFVVGNIDIGAIEYIK